MKDLTIVSQPAKLDFNYEDFKAQLATRLEQYNIVVTEDTVQDAKATATELNGIKRDIDARRKEAIAKVSEPIKAADGQLKELVAMCEEGRKGILTQVERFEDRVKDDALAAAEAMLADLREQQGIEPEYQVNTVDDMRKLGTLTKTGKLTAGCKAEIQGRVSAELIQQQTVERRTLELENLCYKAGLRAPLSREHVAHFIKADPEVYAQKLETLIHAEVERQIAGDQAKADQEALRVKPPEPEKAPEQARPEPPAADPEPTPEPTSQAHYPPARGESLRAGGSVMWEATCVFRVPVPPGLTADRVEAELRRALGAAGFTSLAEVYVSPAEEAA